MTSRILTNLVLIPGRAIVARDGSNPIILSLVEMIGIIFTIGISICTKVGNDIYMSMSGCQYYHAKKECDRLGHEVEHRAYPSGSHSFYCRRCETFLFPNNYVLIWNPRKVAYRGTHQELVADLMANGY